MSILRAVPSLTRVAGLAAVLWSVGIPAATLATPARMGVSVEGPVKVGSKAAVVLQFLDQNFRPDTNDRERIVRLDLLRTGGTQEGRGEMTPSVVKAPAGVSTLSTVRFTGMAAGTVRVRVTSDGLAPGEAVVRIISASSALWEFFAPALHAQASRSFEILPRNLEPIPRNGLATAPFSISVDAPAPAGGLTWRVSTEPAVSITSREGQRTGSTVMVVEAGRYLSQPFEILPPSRPGPVRVRAQRLPAGDVDEVTVEFVPPEPVRIGFDPEFYQAKAEDQILPVHVRLLDDAGIALRELAGSREIRLRSAGGAVEFEQATVMLSGSHANGTATVRLPAFRLGGDVKVLAEGEALRPGQAEVTVMATELAMILMVIAGGFLGGIVRHVYVVGTPRFLPHRTRTHLDPGLIGNALLSALSGVILFLALDVGILHHVIGVDHDMAAVGFVFGALGGFASVRAFDALLNRVLLDKPAVRTSG
jgi:hypothetical protein